MGGWVGGWVDERVDGWWMGGWMDGWMDGWMHEQILALHTVLLEERFLEKWLCKMISM
jgi:hypothetical protein